MRTWYLDYWLKEKKISGRRLAKEIGADRSLVSRWRNCVHEPETIQPSEFFAIAQVLGISRRQLLSTYGEDPYAHLDDSIAC